MPANRADRARTFTETARRAQIVAAAIETIAELGYAQASYGQIAKTASLSSTGLISYHFENKDDLIAQVVDEVVQAGQAFMVPRIAAADGARARLRAYLESNLEFMASHRAHIVAVANILNAIPHGRGGQPAPYADWHEHGIAQLEDMLREGQRTGEFTAAQLEDMLREGQRTGEFTAFATRTMAVTIRAAIDAVGYQLAVDPGLDPAASAGELAGLFDRATRGTGNGSA